MSEPLDDLKIENYRLKKENSMFRSIRKNSLLELIYICLLENNSEGLTLAEIVTNVLSKNYKTKSNRLPSIVQTTIYKLIDKHHLISQNKDTLKFFIT